MTTNLKVINTTVDQNTAAKVVLATSLLRMQLWIGGYVLWGLLFVFGIFSLTQGYTTALFTSMGAFLFLLPIMAIRVIRPFRQIVTFDLVAETLAFTDVHLGIRKSSRRKDVKYQLRQLGLRPGIDGKSLLITLPNDYRIKVGITGEEGTVNAIDRKIQPVLTKGESDREKIEEQMGEEAEVEVSASLEYQKIQAEIASWGRTSIFFAVLQVLAFGLLGASWGMTLLLVGLMSFWIREVAMFVIYAVVLAWVAFNNISAAGFGVWTFFGLYQMVLAYRVFRKFNQYLKIERDYLALNGGIEIDDTKGAKVFPFAGFILGGLSLGSWVSVFIFIIVQVVISEGGGSPPDYASFLEFILSVSVNFGVVALAMGLSSLLSGFKPKWIVILGMAFGGLLVLLNFGLLLLS